MNDKLQQLYDLYKQKGIISNTDFNTFATANDSQKKGLYDLGVKEGLFQSTDYNTFSTAWSGAKQEPVKKKDSTVLASNSGKPTSVSSSKPVKADYDGKQLKPKGADYSKYQKVGDKYYEGQGEIYTDYPGKEGKAYRFSNGAWYEYSSTLNVGGANDKPVEQLKKQIKDPMRVQALNKQYGKYGTTENGVFLGFPGKEQNEYKLEDGQWKRRTPESKTWVTVTNDGSINALNDYFNKEAKPITDKNQVKQIAVKNQQDVDFARNLKGINTTLVGGEEEEAVTKLKKMFPKDTGFTFEEVGAGDRIKVTSPTGNVETFTLDNWTWDDDNKQAAELRGWMEGEYKSPTKKDTPQVEVIKTPGGFATVPKAISADVANVAFTKNAVTEQMTKKSRQAAEILNKYSNYLSDPSAMTEAERIQAAAAIATIADDKEEIRQINQYQRDVKLNKESYTKKRVEAEKYVDELNNQYASGAISREELDAQISTVQKELNDQYTEIKNQEKASDKLTKVANMSAAENAVVQAASGSFGGGMALSAVKGFASPARLLLGAIGTDVSAEKWHEMVKDAVSPIWEFETSLDYLRSEERSDLYKSAFSVAESLGAMAGGGALGITGGITRGLIAKGASTAVASGVAGATTFYPMSYYEMKDELEGVDMPESHKVAMSSIYGVVSSALESLGMEYALGKIDNAGLSAIKRNIMKNFLSKPIAKDAPKEFIEAAIRNETKAYLANLAGGAVGAGAVEGITETTQSLVGAGIKEIYDQIGDKTELFSNEGIGNIVKGALYEGYLGALGGGMVHSIYVAKDAYTRNKAMTTEGIELLKLAARTNGMDEALMANLKADMLSGRMTSQEAKEIAQNFDLVRGNMNQMPDNLTPEAQSVSLSLMMERDRLNKQIEGKDPNLVKPQSERVAEINNRLQEIAQENAVQEQSTGEVPVQSTTGVSEQVEERVPESETEGTTGETVGQENQAQQNQAATITEEERQGAIDSFIETMRTEIEDAYGDNEDMQDSKQKAIDELESDPIAFAMERADNSGLTEEFKGKVNDFLVKIGSGQTVEPTERFEFTEGDVPTALQNVEPIARTETGRRGLFGIGTRGPKTTTLTFSGQQMIDAGLRAPKTQAQPVTEEAVVVEETPVAEVTTPQPTAIPQASVPTRSDVTALNKGTLAPERVDSILMGAIEAQEQGKALNKTQQRIFDENQGRVEEIVSSRTLSDEVTALSSLIEGTEQTPNFQMAQEEKGSKEAVKERKANLEEKATALMERVQPEIASEAFESSEPTKGYISVDVKENQELAQGVPRKSLKDYIGKKMNLLMADLLKVDLSGKVQKMGGAFFPLIPGLKGKVAWASIDLTAAKNIVRGAMNSDISMVYNMNPEAFFSNKTFLNSVMNKISELSDANDIFSEMMSYLQTVKFVKKTDEVHKIARESKSMDEFADKFYKLDVDTKADIMKKILPEENVEPDAKNILGQMLKKDGITKEAMIADNVEQFAADLPAGALTMALNIVDENGNRPTPDTIDNFIIDRKQAEEMGLPIHENYPFYIKGNVDAILTETASFWDVLKDFKRSVDAKIANLIQKKDSYTVEVVEKNKDGKKVKKDVAVKVYNNPNGTRTVEVFKDTDAKGEGNKIIIPIGEDQETADYITKNVGKIKDFKKGGTYSAKEAISSTMRSASMKASSVFKITEPTKGKYQQFIERLSKAFPTLQVVTSQEEFNSMIDDIKKNAANGKQLLTKTQKVYGAVYNGKLYLNPEFENYNTPIHEFGHVWLNIAKTMRTDLYNKGLELIRNSEYMEQVKNSPEYARVVKAMKAQGFSQQEIEQYLEEEALATAIGDKGESFVSAATKRSFNNWLNDVFDFVKKLTGISEVTAEQLQDITLEDFVQGVVVDIMSETQQFKDAEVESFGTQLQLMTGPSGLTMTQIIHMGRSYGFSDAAIKQTLLNQKFKAKDIDVAMQVPYNTVDVMPAAFGNVEGGLQIGLDMFNDINQELEDYARGKTTTTRAPRMTAKERAARVAELRQQNPTLTEISDSELLKRFPKPRQAATVTTERPTRGEVRAKALELLRNHPTFQAQTDTIQMELISAFDKSLATRANNIIQQQINAIRNNLRQRKIGAKELQDSKASLRDLIKKALPKSEAYSDKMVNKLLTIIAKSNANTIMRDTDNVLALVEEQREKMKDRVIKDIFAMVSKKAKPGKTITGRRRSAGLDAEGQAFFETATGILKAVIKGDTAFLDSVKQVLDNATNDGSMGRALNKSLSNQKLTSKERDLLNKLEAYEMLLNVKDMQLEEVNDLFKVLKGRRTQAIMNYASNRVHMAAVIEQINQEATEQVQALNKPLFTEVTDKNGDVEVRPKNENQLNNDKAIIYDFIRNGQIGKAIREAKKNWNFSTPGAIRNFFNNYFKHLGAMMNMFDNKAKGMTFFTENVYNRLNRMDENSKLGYLDQMQMLNTIANSIDGITKGFIQIRNMMQSPAQYRIDMKRGDDRGTSQKNLFNKEQLMRMYALSKNATQRAILERQGLTDAKINEIKDIIGPQAVEFVDKVVEYLSNEYYESVNDVYSAVNDVYLGRVDNYFPTSRVDPNAGTEFNPENPNFSGIFNAETAPSLYERTNSKADIGLTFDFFDVLDNHLQNMERYKAHASGVKILSSIFQNENVVAMLNATKTNALVKNLINYAITPNFNSSHQRTIIDKIQAKFTGFALAFKAVQILKQATSFVNAYEDYSYFPKGMKVPKVVKAPIDLLAFMVDSAYVIATMPKQVKQAYEMSANFRDRVQKGISGDSYVLESGSRLFQPLDKRSDKYGKLRRALKTGAAAPTMIGDVLGVMGYMVNYRRNMKNGMSQEKALEAFNNYNATAQSRRATERSTIQNNQHALTRTFTMFGSTTFLQINKVSMAWKNISDSIKEKKMPEAKDMRAFVLNLGVANALFVLTSNIAKYALGDDEDKEEVLREMRKALEGWNLMLAVPFFSELFQEVDNYINDTKKPVKMGTNPLMSVWYKTKQALKADDVYEATIPLVEIAIGAQVDPAVGLYNIFKGDFDDDDVYKALGISKSYRPSAKVEEGGEEKGDEEMTKEDMKRYYPEMYEQLYGKEGSMYEYEQIIKEQKKIQAEADQREKDALYGFDEKDKDKKSFGSDNTFGEDKKSKEGFGSGNTFGSGM
jgi:hypothetical protein